MVWNRLGDELTKVLASRQQDQVERTVLFTLVPVVLAFIFFVFIFYRHRRENLFKQKEANLRLQAAEGELKALRAQMNPHFIFNCLNSIHHFMSANPDQARGYLIKFSKLIRHVLESSTQKMVPLSDEIEATRDYIELEQLRVNNCFEFLITHTPSIIPERVHIPPMIIQPFIENSIWHGLNHVGMGGKIAIHFKDFNDRHIQCVIEDNGSAGGPSEMDLSNYTKKTSLGLTLINERFAIVNTLLHSKAGFEVAPGRPDHLGRHVTITIPFTD